MNMPALRFFWPGVGPKVPARRIAVSAQAASPERSTKHRTTATCRVERGTPCVTAGETACGFSTHQRRGDCGILRNGNVTPSAAVTPDLEPGECNHSWQSAGSCDWCVPNFCAVRGVENRRHAMPLGLPSMAIGSHWFSRMDGLLWAKNPRPIRSIARTNRTFICAAVEATGVRIPCRSAFHLPLRQDSFHR